MSNTLSRLRTQLHSPDTDTRREATTDLLSVAQSDPRRLAQETDLLVQALEIRDDVALARAVRAVAYVLVESPELAPTVKSALVDAITSLDVASAVVTGIRAVSSLAAEGYVELASEDEQVATLLRHPNDLVREKAARNFADVVSDSPAQYPQSVAAYVDALDDHRRSVRHWAITALGLVAESEPSVRDDWGTIFAKANEFDERFPEFAELEPEIDSIQRATTGTSQAGD